MKRSRVLKKALSSAVKKGQGIDNLVGAYADELLREDDGVRSESQQPEQSGEPECGGTTEVLHQA